jgi:hypothetical protein
MMRNLVTIARRATAFPAIAFWLSFLSAPASLISSVIHSCVIQSRPALRFPTFIELISNTECGPVLKIGFFLSSVAMLAVGHRANRFFRSLCRTRRVHQIFHVLVDLAMSLAIVALLAMAFLQYLLHPLVHGVATVLYFVASLTFHSLIDFGALRCRHYVPMSSAMNVLIAVTGAAAATMFTICDPDSVGMQLSSFVQCACFALIHLKYIFAGSNLLQGNFVPGAVREFNRKLGQLPSSSSSESGFY